MQRNPQNKKGAEEESGGGEDIDAETLRFIVDRRSKGGTSHQSQRGHVEDGCAGAVTTPKEGTYSPGQQDGGLAAKDVDMGLLAPSDQTQPATEVANTTPWDAVERDLEGKGIFKSVGAPEPIEPSGLEVPCTILRRAPPARAMESQPGAFPCSSEGNHCNTEFDIRNAGDGYPAQIPDAHSDGVTSNNGNTTLVGMVEARTVPVEEVAENLPEASPVDQLAAANQKSKRHSDLGRAALLFILLLALGVAIVLGVLLPNHKSSSQATTAMQPGKAPSGSPTSSPSPAPTSVIETFISSLPRATQTSLHNFSSVQWRGMEWLSQHPHLTNLSQWRKEQLFALATFFYAFQGPAWPLWARKHWLDYEKDECLWFSNEWGYFEANGTWTQLSGQSLLKNYGLDPCTEDGRFQALLLDELGLEGRQPFVPPEIGLLTSLKVLGSGFSNISGSLANMLPPEVFHVDLSYLDFIGNQLTGTIPTEIGRIKSLRGLNLHDNQLTSTLPTELGLLRSLNDMTVYFNELTGPIPSEMGLLKDAEVFVMDGNSFSGPIPSELGLMTNLERLWLHDNNLSSKIPGELSALVTNHSLYVLTIEDNPLLSGTIANSFCSLGKLDWDYLNLDASSARGFSFGCTSILCGCHWCGCDDQDNVESGVNATFGL